MFATAPSLVGDRAFQLVYLATQGRWAILGDAAHKVVSAYLYRAGEITQLTKDHTFVQSLIDEGLTPDQIILGDLREPLAMFAEAVSHDGREVPRFAYLGPD